MYTESYKVFITLFLFDLLKSSLKEDQPNSWLFEYLRKSFQELDNKSYNFTDFHLWFMIGLIKFISFYPNLRESSISFPSQRRNIYIHVYRSRALLERYRNRLIQKIVPD
ncbi:MAG: DNA repair protein RecO C-terminal domain-containing protein [Flavobacteriales bacterium AspAUS03]